MKCSSKKDTSVLHGTLRVDFDITSEICLNAHDFGLGLSNQLDTVASRFRRPDLTASTNFRL